ncbi:hypothetical protein DL95DRAFT_405170 [Leptodontidium sp. 2 PMI_412]|nr:hypothetical protein DL95DRAFT_405170 [Leptodontidium sp. 2 PMI_412]
MDTCTPSREYTDLTNFDPSAHSLFKIHTHITVQGFIFINFDASPPPSITFTSQFSDDFDPCPPSPTGQVIGNEYALLPTPSEWTYDHTWLSFSIGTNYNWKTLADGFQECYHCATGHPSTLPRDFALNESYLRQDHGASRHFLPPRPEKVQELGESYTTGLYPEWDEMGGEGEEHERWLREEVGYWRFVEKEDVELAVAAQGGFDGGVLGRGRLPPVQEHAVKWYQDKVRKTWLEHKEMEIKEGKIINYATLVEQAAFEEGDALWSGFIMSRPVRRPNTNLRRPGYVVISNTRTPWHHAASEHGISQQKHSAIITQPPRVEVNQSPEATSATPRIQTTNSTPQASNAATAHNALQSRTESQRRRHHQSLSLSEDNTAPLFELVPKFTTEKPFFPYKFSGNASHISQCFDVTDNVTGYFAFTPFLLCAEGTLSECKNGTVEDGTAITICAPHTYGPESDRSPNGAQNFVTTDRETVANLTGNPAATRTPIVSAAGRMATLGGGIQLLGGPLWLTVCVGLGSSFVL